MSETPLRSDAVNKACGYVITSKESAEECMKSPLFVQEDIIIGLVVGFVIGLFLFMILHAMQPAPVVATQNTAVNTNQIIPESQKESLRVRSSRRRSSYHSYGKYDYDAYGYPRRGGGYDRYGNPRPPGKPIKATHLLVILFCTVLGGVVGYYTSSPPDVVAMYKEDKRILDRRDRGGMYTSREANIANLEQRRIDKDELRKERANDRY